MTQLVTTLQHLSLPPALAQPLEHFVALFEKWNRSINLSAARTHDEITSQVADSLFVVPHLARLGVHRLLDVGAGGGLPSVIIALCRPDIEVTALEPVHKKHAFLRTAARELALSNLHPFATRLEDHRDRDYDAATSRATFDLLEWFTRARDFIRPGGSILGFEGVPRDDLPSTAERFPYDLDGKHRAIVIDRPPLDRST